MRIVIPELSLVVLVGITGSGKSSFARAHFLPTEIVSSDFCRALVSDDENNLDATQDAFELLYYIVRKRLAAGRLTVVDATNVRAEDRARLVSIAREYHCLPVAIILNTPLQVTVQRNSRRPDRDFGSHVNRSQQRALRAGMSGLKREGFSHIYELRSVAEIDAAVIERQRLWNNRREDHGPFDIIGDIHGCYDELSELIRKLGYGLQQEGELPGDCLLTAPIDSESGSARRLIFLGDLGDRGPATPAVLRLVMRLCAEGKALCVPGNHDNKLLRWLRGHDVQLTHGLDLTAEQLGRESAGFRHDVSEFIDGLVSHFVLDEGKLVVAHAGMKQEMQGRGSRAVREFAMYGETTGETDEFGLPIRYNWAAEYRGSAMVVYGHTPVPYPQWLNNTINIDTGCVFGGMLTALRYPEGELVSVAAHETYSVPRRPIGYQLTPGYGISQQQQHDQLLAIEDVLGKRIVDTALLPRITLREEQSSAALEAMSRFAVDPRWLIYLPPTMSPPPVSEREELLEHPEDVFRYYRRHGAGQVVCEEKHMGSRAVVVLCRDAKAARARFGVEGTERGIVYTRSGRRYFEDEALEREFLDALGHAAESSGFWQRHQTDWVCLDCELMPWSHKAQALLEQQYAKVGSAAAAALEAAQAELAEALRAGDERSEVLSPLLQRIEARQAAVRDYIAAYRRYCWPVNSLAELRLAPFHLLASEGVVHSDKDHHWHLAELSLLCDAGAPLLQRTRSLNVDLASDESCVAGAAWWEELTASGGEGMVVKPLAFVLQTAKGLAQPAVKCRGREYLRIIYGAEYTLPEQMKQLRQRSLQRKRALAEKEFALGLEGLARFVRREPLRRVHECVFGVLALESEPVDPRL